MRIEAARQEVRELVSEYQETDRWMDRLHGRGTCRVALLVVSVSLLSQPVLAQEAGASFCQTALARTIMNAFVVIQFGGPLIGGVIALGATVGLSATRRADMKRELKELRNQGVVWGVVVAPLGTEIIQFILNNVVAGGASCAF
jgi:hypothetical protein